MKLNYSINSFVWKKKEKPECAEEEMFIKEAIDTQTVNVAVFTFWFSHSRVFN